MATICTVRPEPSPAVVIHLEGLDIKPSPEKFKILPHISGRTFSIF